MRMCGICGQFDLIGRNTITRERLKAMADSIAHRGPDDEGYYQGSGYGTGFRRLSIIDLAGGHQPMSDETETIWVTFNGEIYNYRAVRHFLEGRGHRFRTNSDTEVFVYGYREWGDDVFRHLNGMFGVAIWDEKRRRLLLARDRLGIKLVYYHLAESVLTFGSEMRAITAALRDKPKVSADAMQLFLRWRYTPSPLTIYEGIRKLAPGTMLVAEESGVRVQRWWDYRPRVDQGMTLEQAEERVGVLYRQSVERHLISDVPVGLLLSGGMDSALLLALMNQLGSNWRSFSVGFGNSYHDDELEDAASTAKQLGSIHREVRIDRLQFEQALPKVVSCLEEPIATASVVPMFFVSQLAAQDVKVALIGQGPDEMFGGYTRHLGLRFGRAWRRLPEPMRAMAKRVLQRLPRAEVLKRAAYSLDVPDRLDRYLQVFSLNTGGAIESLFRQDVALQSGETLMRQCWAELAELMQDSDELGGFQFLELRSSLPDELLMYADKLSMAHSIELRVPYLDYELVEFVETIPEHIKTRVGERKGLHKRVAARYLPQSIIGRKKRGFSVNVVDDWFGKALAGKLNDYLVDPKALIYTYLEPAPVRQLLEEHRSGRHDNYKLLFSLVILEEWLRAR